MSVVSSQLSVISSRLPGVKRGAVFAASLVMLMTSYAFCNDANREVPLIPEDTIAEFEVVLKDVGVPGGTVIEQRRQVKNVARKGLALVEAYPGSRNRFRVLGLVFQAQKKLLALENSERNRMALFETCAQLAGATDEYAEARLEAELLLSEKQMSDKNATLAERADALSGLIERYRGTSAEAKSLLMGALIVQKLDAPELEARIYDALDENYSDDPEVIEFRRQFLKVTRLDLSFSGSFKTVAGDELVFPLDIMGHMSLHVFWSKGKPGIDDYLERIKKDLAKYPGRIDVFSYNLDEMGDGGASILRERGLDWKVMKLPGGRAHQAYRTYAQGDPVAILVNEYGFSVIRPEIVHGRLSDLDPARISEDRCMAQLQALFIGDFLVASQDLHTSGDRSQMETASELRAVQECFVPPPFRYRLSREEALGNYQKAASLCADAMLAPPEGAALWALRNYRIIAWLGIWNLAGEPTYLEQAMKEAQAALEADLPHEAAVVPRFCMAKAAIRAGELKAEEILSGFIKECGGADAPASAIAAAAILALDARSRELHEDYRSLFLETHRNDPELYSFTSFLLDRYHRGHLLKPNYTISEWRPRAYIVGHAHAATTNSLPQIELLKLDGSRLILPEASSGKLTYLLFVEPPADVTQDFPVQLDRNGTPSRNDAIRTVMAYAEHLAASHVNGDINVVAAFLTDDVDHIKHLVATNGWSCQAAVVPGGLKNPMVRQLGILSADRIPNVFVLRRDGTVAWYVSGLRYQNEFGYPFAVLLALNVHVEVCDIELGYRELAGGDFKKAASVFSGPFPPDQQMDRYNWRGPREHGRSLAYMGLKDWVNALEAIDAAIIQHKRRHFRGQGPRNAEEWPKVLADYTMEAPCDVLVELWKTKSGILDELGRRDEADKLRRLADTVETEDRMDVYKQFHERLNALRIQQMGDQL